MGVDYSVSVLFGFVVDEYEGDWWDLEEKLWSESSLLEAGSFGDCMGGSEVRVIYVKGSRLEWSSYNQTFEVVPLDTPEIDREKLIDALTWVEDLGVKVSEPQWLFAPRVS